LEITSLQPQHLEDAARLFATCYRREREQVPILPSRHEDSSGILSVLSDLSRQAPGVAALRNSRLCGYLIGVPIPSFKGTARGVYCPIWAHAAVGDDGPEIYRHMYGRISNQWVEDRCLTHAITLYAQDSEAIDVWFRNCFGLLVVDALRPLDPVSATVSSEVMVRQAGLGDLHLILPLEREHVRYMRGGPIFLPLLETFGRDEYASWLAEPAHTLWLALHNGGAVAYMCSRPPKPDVAYIVSDPGTISTTGVYVKPQWRGRGIATLLLRHMIEWARSNGYERCSVDFESQNMLGSRFWLRHFQPICYSLIRRLDERIAWAGKDNSTASVY